MDPSSRQSSRPRCFVRAWFAGFRRLAILLIVAAGPVARAQSQPFAVVSAASYQPVVAPDSLATIFGVNLASSAASATLDANGQLPTLLAGTTVTVDGQPAALIYVSAGQINFLIPASTSPGTVNVTVQSTVIGNKQTATMQVAGTAPGIFTSDASGAGPGSILNAVTYAGPPFLVETPENGGSDLRTRLAIYGTGVRYAGDPGHNSTSANHAASVQATGQDSTGTRYTFVVEYAGPAPGYFGLDQVNIVLPPELDGAGTITLTISTDSATSKPVTFQMGSLPPGAVRLTGLTLSQAFVNAGDSVTGTVTLNAPARSIGFTASLRSSSPAVQLPLSIMVPTGKTSASFSITSSANVPTVQTATITAQAGADTQTATLEIDPPNAAQLSSFTVTPSSVQGGHSTSATVVLSDAAPAGGTSVAIASDSAAATPPSAVTVPFANNSVIFSVPTAAVDSVQTANLTATFGRTSKTAQLTVSPALQLTLTNSTVIGGNSASGTVTIGDPAPIGGVLINFRSDNATIAPAPSSINIPSGQRSATFSVVTIPVTVSRTVTITASSPAFTQTATASFTVNPVGSGTLANLTVAPSQVAGGGNASGTVTLTAAAPAGGTVVNLRSSSTYALVPQLVTVPQGQSSIAFTITTSHPPSPQTATITATAGGVTRTATLSVQ
ncbi:MAG TPA: IPT/TIG domain-containing protein [Bryobacteraceae bacterium]